MFSSCKRRDICAIRHNQMHLFVGQQERQLPLWHARATLPFESVVVVVVAAAAVAPLAEIGRRRDRGDLDAVAVDVERDARHGADQLSLSLASEQELVLLLDSQRAQHMIDNGRVASTQNANAAAAAG